eukprot:gb/GEZN01014402.1/.p1 GENE.gb/GEZN01014402.1/~~gb/GEZN01014402.1/.p1  ORF type:complete len:289 (+),score=22.05 gb/GEZN01014402.1/:25-891(+)
MLKLGSCRVARCGVIVLAGLLMFASGLFIAKALLPDTTMLGATEVFQDEGMLDVVNEKGEFLYALPFTDVHRLGLLHKGVHIFVFDRTGQTLLIQRTKNAVYSPNRWSFAGEHNKAGESYAAAAVRCLEEEVSNIYVSWPKAQPKLSIIRGPVYFQRITQAEDPSQRMFGGKDLHLAIQYAAFFDAVGQRNQVGGHEVQASRWISLSDLAIELKEHPEWHLANQYLDLWPNMTEAYELAMSWSGGAVGRNHIIGWEAPGGRPNKQDSNAKVVQDPQVSANVSATRDHD